MQYRFTGDGFNIPDVFFAISLMTLPRLTMSLFFNFAVQHMTEVVVSTKRLDHFFRLPEPQSYAIDDKCSSETGEVLMVHGNYGWYGTNEDDSKQKKSMKVIERLISKVMVSCNNRVIRILLISLGKEQKAEGRTSLSSIHPITDRHQFSCSTRRTDWNCWKSWKLKELGVVSFVE